MLERCATPLMCGLGDGISAGEGIICPGCEGGPCAPGPTGDGTDGEGDWRKKLFGVTLRTAPPLPGYTLPPGIMSGGLRTIVFPPIPTKLPCCPAAPPASDAHLLYWTTLPLDESALLLLLLRLRHTTLLLLGLLHLIHLHCVQLRHLLLLSTHAHDFTSAHAARTKTDTHLTRHSTDHPRTGALHLVRSHHTTHLIGRPRTHAYSIALHRSSHPAHLHLWPQRV
uniref:Uncharacterized protein n=1 Tax=Anopheles culicifacies TaxID=139723 RepID=A0A182LUZ5_9DIPT